jgi:MtN3 and saliva related transmembrane protein
MQYGIYILGTLATALSSFSYLPQLKKAMPRDSTSDLSLDMLVALSVVYGVARDDWVIILANSDRRNTRARRARVQNSRLEFMISAENPFRGAVGTRLRKPSGAN